SERLPDRHDVDVGRDVLRVLALQEVRDAAGELDDLEAAVHLAEGVARHLAVLAGDERGDVPLVFLDELAEGKEDPRALRQRRGSPGLRRLARGRHRGVHVGRRGERHARRALARGGIEHVARALARALHRLATDPMTYLAHRMPTFGSKGTALI